MAHVMASFSSLDHAFVRCPAYKREVKAGIVSEMRRRARFHAEMTRLGIEPVSNPGSWSLFFDPDAEWEAEEDGSPPFGLCGWCWRVYQARKRRAEAA